MHETDVFARFLRVSVTVFLRDYLIKVVHVMHGYLLDHVYTTSVLLMCVQINAKVAKTISYLKGRATLFGGQYSGAIGRSTPRYGFLWQSHYGIKRHFCCWSNLLNVLRAQIYSPIW